MSHSILILQGGGSLGAYECGVYQVLAPHLNHLNVVAGTSIGAINASLIAKNYHQEDHGVKYLTDFWNEVLAHRSFNFESIPVPLQAYTAVWTSLLFGNPHMFTPRPWWDSIIKPSNALSYYSVEALEKTLASYFGSYDSRQEKGPRLVLTAVDIELGEQHAFDSGKELITPEHIVASGSLPPSFPYKKLDGHYYWDGGVWNNTPLPEVLDILQHEETVEEFPTYQVYIVDVFPKEGHLPTTPLEAAKRRVDLTFADKTAEDRTFSLWINRYLDLIQTLHARVEQLPKDLAAEIEQKYERLAREQKRVLLEFVYIKRSALPNEHISGGTDFSPHWIESLMHQGNLDATRALNEFNKQKQKAREGAAVKVLS